MELSDDIRNASQMKCKVCQKEFSTEIGLLQHQSATSCGQSLFKCRMYQKDFGNKPALLQHIAAVHPKGSVAGGASAAGGAAGGGGATKGVYRVCDISEIRISMLENNAGWSVGESVSFTNSGGQMVCNSKPISICNSKPMTPVPSNLPTTLESDGRGLFTFTSTGQRFQGTSTSDGAMKITRPNQRVIIEHCHRCVPVTHGDCTIGTSFFARPDSPLHLLKQGQTGVVRGFHEISCFVYYDIFESGKLVGRSEIRNADFGQLCLLFEFKGVLESVRATPRP
jgi:hypothetical protein